MPLTQLRNMVVTAVNEHTLFPRYIILVLDIDMIQRTGHFDFGLSMIIERQVKWLSIEICRLIKAYKTRIVFIEKLPIRAKKDKYPTVIWMGALCHIVFNDNDKRKKFNDSLQYVCQGVKDTFMLRPKLIWDFNNRNLVVKTHNSTHYRIT